jgi:hypothetical protein
VFNENAPVFNAAGSGLAANYAVNFTADLSHTIPTEGSWQGDRKECASLYIDNYNNDFAILVAIGSGVVRCPAYSQGYVSLDKHDRVIVTAEQAATVNMTLYTEPKPDGFTARGNAPVSVTSTPFISAGTINLGAANDAAAMVYCPFDGMIYVFTRTTKLCIKINPTTNQVVNALTLTKNPTCASAHHSQGIVFFGTDDGFMAKILLPGFTQSAFVVNAGVAIQDMKWRQGNNKLYTTLIVGNPPKSYDINLTFVSNPSAFNANYLVDNVAAGLMYGAFDTAGANNLWAISTSDVNAGSITTGFNQGMMGSAETTGRIYGTTNTTTVIPYTNLVAGTNVATDATGPTGYAWNSGTGNVLVGYTDGKIDFVNALLNSSVALTTLTGGAVRAICYNPTTQRSYVAKSTGIIHYIDD